MLCWVGHLRAVQPGPEPGRWSPSWDSTFSSRVLLRGVFVEMRDPRYPRGRGWGTLQELQAEAGALNSIC